MRSLRTRLTWSYAVSLGTALVVAVVALTIVAVEAALRPVADEIAGAARAARDVVARAGPRVPPARVEAEIVGRVSRPGLAVFVLAPHGTFRPGQLRPPDEPRPPLDLRPLILPAPARIAVGDDDFVVIGAEREYVAWVLHLALEALAAAVLVVLVAAWLLARWLTRQAIAPLVDVTTKLQQFATGSAAPQPLQTGDRSELGALIGAYNGAAAQVAAAFEERALVEEHMRRFIADAGHELRTPLSVVKSAHAVLRKGAVDDPQLRERLFRSLDAETSRMDALVERLVALARLERPEHAEPEAIDVVEVAEDVVTAVRAARGGEVTIEGAPTAVAFVDRNDLYEALGNLVDNAVKYGEGSRVRIGVSVGGAAVRVTVQDGGPGIPPGDRPHIFERFYRGWMSRNAGGSGLGLAIAHRAIERAGGTLELCDGEPRRTTFAFDVPRA